MASYVISDIHGAYDLFIELLEKIDLADTDTLYILGDVLDRGPNPITTLRKLMEMPNVICILGNHELMAVECLDFLMQMVTEDSIDGLDAHVYNNLLTWQFNGSASTINEFRKLTMDERVDVLEFIKDFSIYEEVKAGKKKYLLVHAGLGNYSPKKKLDDYSLKEMVWDRADYDTQYFPDTYVVTGHTPTMLIPENPNPGFIFRKNNHIAMDCGACFQGGRLAAFCLDTEEEFYSSVNKG